MKDRTVRHSITLATLTILVAAFLSLNTAKAQDVVFNLTGMTPHVGQKFEARLIDKRTGKEADRISVAAIGDPDFSLTLFGSLGESYFLDFYADLNQNGIYDTPPADHAWRMEVDDLTSGDNEVTFSHNTNFTDIDWRYLLDFDFTSMTPHVGQKLEIAVRDISLGGKEAGRATINAIPSASFSVGLPFLQLGHSYRIDFYADLNQNGVYDLPPTDHAWRMMLAEVTGDEDIAFDHNTNFTDIGWKHRLTMNFTSMTPHVGQQLEIRVRDLNQTGREVGRFSMPAIALADFSVDLPYLDLGRTYMVDFYADLSQNGAYDAPPADHAWREMVVEVSGDESLTFDHNTNFTDIGESYMLTVDFTNMNPHVGQLLELRVLETATGKEVERARQMIQTPDFRLSLPGIQSGKEYDIDFYADLSQNGLYDAPPADHAWRETFTAGSNDETVVFNHNTNFTDISWRYLFTLAATNMNPHLGQLFELRLVNTSTGAEVNRFSMPSIMTTFFFVRVPGLELGENYNADFYADLNQNGAYDAPPADHAWRLNFDDDEGDEMLDFPHNTDFTDIAFPTAVDEIETLEDLQVFPNPFDESITLQLKLTEATSLSGALFNSTGQKLQDVFRKTAPAGESTLRITNLDKLPSGLYFLKLQNDKGEVATLRMVKW